MKVEIVELAPTPRLRRENDGLRQAARLKVRCTGGAGGATVRVATPSGAAAAVSVALKEGESVLEVEVPEVTGPCEVVCELRPAGRLAARLAVPWQPPRRWVVHVVQHSHHDVGYTDLASRVLPEHDRWLDATLEMASATRRWRAACTPPSG